MATNNQNRGPWGPKEWAAVISILLLLAGHAVSAFRWAAGMDGKFVEVQGQIEVVRVKVAGLQENVNEAKAQITRLWERKAPANGAAAVGPRADAGT